MPLSTLRQPAVRRSLAVCLPLLLIACTGTVTLTPPPSGACVVADAGNNVQLSAKDIKFSAPCIEAAAGVPIVIHFTNQEDMPHNVAVYSDSSKTTELVKGDIITGPNASTTVTVPAQQPGLFFYECSVHNSMNGALVVRAAPAASGG